MSALIFSAMALYDSLIQSYRTHLERMGFLVNVEMFIFNVYLYVQRLAHISYLQQSMLNIQRHQLYVYNNNVVLIFITCLTLF